MENHTHDETTGHLTRRVNSTRLAAGHSSELPAIPAKRYFTIGEVSELCGVKAHVLRYWEQEFTQLKPVKRRGNRRYYQHHEVVLIRRIRQLLYEEGFTINGARGRLDQYLPSEATAPQEQPQDIGRPQLSVNLSGLRRELREILDLLQT
ncbi:MAG: MerR family transcriptional regulator [Gallionellaceae bacterium]|nr:MAG: MerR family transcriptional regulator [Gallionellaceae bacterium]